MLRIVNLKLRLGEEESRLRRRIAERLKIRESELTSYTIFKKAVDARQGKIVFVYTVDATLRHEERVLARARERRIEGVTPTPDQSYHFVATGQERLPATPVVIGTGPAGLFAGLLLAEMGYRPLLLERGAAVEERRRAVERFWSEGHLDPNCNVQFGEGGAGTFSDGKLNTLIHDPRCRRVLELFVEAGAPEEILYLNKPHLGTDLLKGVVRKLRERIVNLGGEVRFHAQVTDFLVEERRLVGLVVNGSQKISCGPVLLGIGHSARDTFATLLQRGVELKQKPFAIGVRIEHPQELIDRAQYGEWAGHPELGAADYKLVYHSPGGRSAYTFCNCPGGYVVAAASEAGGVVTNGMSFAKRDGENANSALLVGVGPQDFGSSHPLAGVEFQRRWERLAFELGGGGYRAPAQLLADFLAGKGSTRFGDVKPSYRPGVTPAQIDYCLPPYVTATLREALPSFAQKIASFDLPEAVLTGVETRSSSPVRIVRDERGCACLDGLYPIGEGAGYAGGIISAAVDGIKGAEQVASRYAPPD